MANFRAKLFEDAIKNGPLPLIANQVKSLNQPLKGHPLIVVHPLASSDQMGLTKNAIDQTISQFKAQQASVVYLLQGDESQHIDVFTEDRNPTYALYSCYGEHNLELNTSEVTVVGGYFTQSISHTIKDLISRHDLFSKEHFTIHLPMKAIYDLYPELTTQSVLYNHASADSQNIKSFIQYIKDSLFTEESIEANKNSFFELAGFPALEWQGSVNSKNHRFSIFIDNELQETLGDGKNIYLKFSSQ